MNETQFCILIATLFTCHGRNDVSTWWVVLAAIALIIDVVEEII